jgi:hypothetical protein
MKPASSGTNGTGALLAALFGLPTFPPVHERRTSKQMPLGLKDSLRMARLAKEQEIVTVLLQRPDLSYEAIGKLFGVSDWPIKQIVQKYQLSRPRGRKTKNVTRVTANGPLGA